MDLYSSWTPTTYERIPYAPHNSTMHDERCSCPWCMPDAPDDLSPFERGAIEARQQDEDEETAEWERLNEEREAMELFNAVPSYVERFQDCITTEVDDDPATHMTKFGVWA